MSQNNISDKAIIGKNVKIGSFNIIEKTLPLKMMWKLAIIVIFGQVSSSRRGRALWTTLN